jgi:hypothetical protein
MNFNSHPNLVGKHAFLSASKYSWIRYDEDKLIETYGNHQNAMMGSRLHQLASDLIGLGVKLPRTQKTLNLFVNDVIGFRMVSELVLFFSDNVFGTADALGFRKPPKSDRFLLQICHEYGWKPQDIDVELRIYQHDDVQILIPVLEDIVPIMEKMVRFDNLIEQMKAEAEL